MPNRRKATIWTNDVPGCRRIYASLGHTDLRKGQKINTQSLSSVIWSTKGIYNQRIDYNHILFIHHHSTCVFTDYGSRAKQTVKHAQHGVLCCINTRYFSIMTHDMETLSTLLTLCEENPPLNIGLPVLRTFLCFFYYLSSTNCWKKLLRCHCLRCHATHVSHYNIVTVKQSHFCVTQWVSTWELQGRDNGCRNPPWFQNAHANGPFITDMTRMPSH